MTPSMRGTHYSWFWARCIGFNKAIFKDTNIETPIKIQQESLSDKYQEVIMRQ